MVILFLIYLPGILIHEASHWLIARILGLKTSKFRVWPKFYAQLHRIGECDSFASGGALWDSLVGLAPLLVGSALIVLIGEQVFDTETVAFAWRTGKLLDGLTFVVDGLARKPDSPVVGLSALCYRQCDAAQRQRPRTAEIPGASTSCFIGVAIRAHRSVRPQCSSAAKLPPRSDTTADRRFLPGRGHRSGDLPASARGQSCAEYVSYIATVPTISPAAWSNVQAARAMPGLPPPGLPRTKIRIPLAPISAAPFLNQPRSPPPGSRNSPECRPDAARRQLGQSGHRRTC